MAQQILLLGAYGQNNLGDDALLEVFIAQLHEFQIIVNSAQPGQTSQRYQIEALSTYGIWPRLRYLQPLLASDIIVFGGGSLLKEIEGRTFLRILYFLRILAILLFAKIYGRRTAMVGVGMGPLNQPLYRWLSLQAANLTNLICVRDTASRDLLIALGVTTPVHITADPVLTLVPDSSRSSGVPNQPPTIVVIPRYSLSSAEQDALAAACDDLVERYHVSILLIAFQTGYQAHFDDLHAAQAILGRMAHAHSATICVPETPQAALTLIGQADLVLSTRLHGLIFAAIQGVAAVAINYEVKVQSFMDEIGQPWASVSLEQLAAGNLPAVLDRAWQNRAGIATQTRSHLDLLRTHAQRNFALLHALASPPHGPAEHHPETVTHVPQARQRSKRDHRLLFLGALALAMLLMIWQVARAEAPTVGHPAQQQIAQIMPSLINSEAEHASGAYIPGVGAIVTLRVVRGPNAIEGKASYLGMRDWMIYLMQTFGPQLAAVPAAEQIAISADYYDYDDTVYHQLVILTRAADAAEPSAYIFWLDGKPYDQAVGEIEASKALIAAPAGSLQTPALTAAPLAPTVASVNNPAAGAGANQRTFDFTDPQASANDWTPLSDAWAFVDQGYSYNAIGIYDQISMLNQQVSGDMSYQAQVKFLEGELGAGLIFNAPDLQSRNGAHMISYTAKGTYLQWGAFGSDGVFSYIGGSNVPAGNDGKWHTLLVQVTGTTYSVSLDGALLAGDIPLSGPPGGHVGLTVSTSHVIFDNIQWSGAIQ